MIREIFAPSIASDHTVESNGIIKKIPPIARCKTINDANGLHPDGIETDCIEREIPRNQKVIDVQKVTVREIPLRDLPKPNGKNDSFSKIW